MKQLISKTSYFKPSIGEIEAAPVKTEAYLNASVICKNETDPRCPFKYGKLYTIKNGELEVNKTLKFTNIESLDKLEEITRIRFGEIKGVHNNGSDVYFTGYLYCDKTSDPRVFKVGYLYPVLNGSLRLRDFSTNHNCRNGASFAKALSEETLSHFIPVADLSSN